MDNGENNVGGAGADFASRDLGGGAGVTGSNVPVADKAPSEERDPFAYRNAGQNGRRRAEFMERVVIDAFYGGSIRRFDEAAGLDFDA